MRIESCIKALVVLAVSVACAAFAPPTNSGVLSGKMAWWQQVVGFWSCEINLEPSPGQYAQKGVTVAQGWVAPDNVFHWSERASGFYADQYNGYSADKRVWWETQADSNGLASVFRSSDGLTYEGSPPSWSVLGEDRSRYRETYNIHRDGTFHEEVKRLLGGSWRPFSESSCTRK